MKIIGITIALTTCLTAACLAPGYEDELGEASFDDLEETSQKASESGMETKSLVLPAQTSEEWRLFMASDDTSRVRSMEDWEACLLDSTCNPLGGVDPATVDAFTRSLIFRNGGLAGASFEMLETILTYTELINLWDTFGIGEKLFVAVKDAECNGPGDCGYRMNHICTDNC